jgi:hypothetical protein
VVLARRIDEQGSHPGMETGRVERAAGRRPGWQDLSGSVGESVDGSQLKRAKVLYPQC